jgi:hypothetical protein
MGLSIVLYVSVEIHDMMATRTRVDRRSGFHRDLHALTRWLLDASTSHTLYIR